MIQKQHRFLTGFTLIEMMVSVAIFSMVVLVSIGAITTVIRVNQRVQTLKSVMENLNFALASMSRSIRFGNSYSCGDLAHVNDCPYPNGSSVFGFIDENGIDETYRLNGTAIERLVGSGGGYLPITAPEAVVTTLTFFVEGAENEADEQPRVKVVVRGYVGNKEDTKSYFNLNTYISERRIYFGN